MHTWSSAGRGDMQALPSVLLASRVGPVTASGFWLIHIQVKHTTLVSQAPGWTCETFWVFPLKHLSKCRREEPPLPCPLEKNLEHHLLCPKNSPLTSSTFYISWKGELTNLSRTNFVTSFTCPNGEEGLPSYFIMWNSLQSITLSSILKLFSEKIARIMLNNLLNLYNQNDPPFLWLSR